MVPDGITSLRKLDVFILELVEGKVFIFLQEIEACIIFRWCYQNGKYLAKTETAELGQQCVC